MYLTDQGSMSRLAHEIGGLIVDAPRFGAGALGSLQSATERYLVGLFDDAAHCAERAQSTAVRAADLRLARQLRGEAQIDAACLSKQGRQEQGCEGGEGGGAEEQPRRAALGKRASRGHSGKRVRSKV